MGRKFIHREKHTLPPQRWRAIVIVTDTPSPGEAYLTLSEVQQHLVGAVDLPAGLTFEVGTIEMAAKGGGG